MRIKKNGTVLNVTKGAFKALFAPMGYVSLEDEEIIVDEHMAERQEKLDVPFGNILNNEPPYDEGEKDDSEYEVVLEDMTMAELVEYSAEQDIDIEGLRKKQDIINRIREMRA